MIYLLKMVIFHGELLNNQMVIIEDALSMFTGFTTAYPPLKPSSNTNHVKTLIAYTQNHIQPITSRIHYSWHSWYVYIRIYNFVMHLYRFPFFLWFPMKSSVFPLRHPRQELSEEAALRAETNKSKGKKKRKWRRPWVVPERMGMAHGQIYGMFHRIQGKPIVKSRFKNWKQLNRLGSGIKMAVWDWNVLERLESGLVFVCLFFCQRDGNNGICKIKICSGTNHVFLENGHMI